MDLNCGSSIITKPMMRSELLQRRKTEEPLRIFGIDGKTQKAIGWNDEFVRKLDHIVQSDISHESLAEQRGRYSNLVNPRGTEEDMQGMPLIKRCDIGDNRCPTSIAIE